MAHAIRVHAYGGPEVLKWEAIDVGAPGPGRELGEHPKGGKVTVKDGRYGAYVNWGKVNATLPKGVEPKDVTVEQAVTLIAERAAKGPAAKKGRFGKAKAAKADGDAKPAKAKAKSKKAKVTADED